MSATQLIEEWVSAKATEKNAVEARRSAEDRMIEALHVQQSEGSKTFDVGDYKVRVTQRFNRSIDADLLQEVAAEHGMTAHLQDLFRWKPEINAKAWSSAEESITAPLLAAITTKPGRPSFSIDKTE